MLEGFPMEHEGNHEFAVGLRKYRGVAVLQGNSAKDGFSHSALFLGVVPSASLMAASTLFDLAGSLPGHIIQQSDAPQTYTKFA